MSTVLLETSIDRTSFLWDVDRTRKRLYNYTNDQVRNNDESCAARTIKWNRTRPRSLLACSLGACDRRRTLSPSLTHKYLFRAGYVSILTYLASLLQASKRRKRTRFLFLHKPTWKRRNRNNGIIIIWKMTWDPRPIRYLNFEPREKETKRSCTEIRFVLPHCLAFFK